MASDSGTQALQQEAGSTDTGSWTTAHRPRNLPLSESMSPNTERCPGQCVTYFGQPPCKAVA